MTITFDPPESDLGSNLVGENFSFAITLTSDDPLDPITEVTVTTSIDAPSDNPFENVVFDPPLGTTSNTDVVTIEGFYTIGLFPNYRTGWVEPGTADVTRRTGNPNDVVPPGKDLTDVRPDPVQQYIVDYIIDVSTLTLSDSKTYNHTVFHDYGEAKNFIENYLEIK